jgi:CheY-like chemotaxis protein
LTVLVVDDDAAVRRTTTAMLRELGHAVVEAADGPEALAVAEGTALDLAVVDFAMPVMDGGALATALVAFRPGLPVLLLTGYADRAHADAVSGNFAGLLAKPCSLDEIDCAVRAATRSTLPSMPQAV